MYHKLAGQLAQADQLVNIPKLMSCYYRLTPDPSNSSQQVSFGTSGHRGNAFDCTFNEVHIAAICQAIADYRQQNQISGPLFLGMDTHALSEAAFITAIEVLAANNVNVVTELGQSYTPTPVISRSVVRYNIGRTSGFADGVVITPSHNPPQDGGVKYNPPHGGPADSDVTGWIQTQANRYIQEGLSNVKRISFTSAMNSEFVTEQDLAKAYIDELDLVIDMAAIKQADLKLGTDPLGGSGLYYWDRIADKYGLDITVVNKRVDPQFSFMHLDKDGKIRMDCSSPFAMKGLIELKDKFDLAFGNDPDFDRHGIVTKSAGLMNPNHYLACAIDYLYQHRPQWNGNLGVGKTLVSSSMIDRVAERLGRELIEMPVGFKWFVTGLTDQQIGFAGEESAGGIFLQRNGSTWATDKDGFIMCLLAAEMMAVTGEDPAQKYQALIGEFGEPNYKRIDVAASLEDKKRLASLNADDIKFEQLAGEQITQIQTHAPGNNAAIGGVKVSTQNGWFAARPSGTENVYKIYAESFLGESHLEQLLQEAQNLVQSVLS